MTETGKKVTPEEFAEVRALWQEVMNAPVMRMRSDLPTFAETALGRFQARIDSLAAEHGLPELANGDRYGVRYSDGMLVRP